MPATSSKELLEGLVSKDPRVRAKQLIEETFKGLNR